MRPGLLALVAALLLAAPAHAATVANPGPVTLTGGTPPGEIAGYSANLNYAGSVDADGDLLFPAAGIEPVVFAIPPSVSAGLEIHSGQLTLSRTHDATGTIDPAAGAASVNARFEGTVTADTTFSTGFVTADIGVTCLVGSVAEPAALPLSTEPLVPPSDAPEPYDQATGRARMVGRLSLPTFSASDCEFTGGFVATLVDAFSGFFAGTLQDMFDNAPVTLATRFDPAPHAPGFTLPSNPVTVPSAAILAQAPSNAFKVGSAALSSSKGWATLTLDLPGPGTVKALATANVPAGAAKKITVAKLTRRATRAGKLKLTLKPSKAALRYLRRRGKLRTRMKLTYTPTGGSARSTTRNVTLKLKRKRR